MKIRNVLLDTTMLFALLTGTAAADPKNGFSLNAAEVAHVRDCGGCTGSSTSGFSVGMDYQFAMSDTLSINPFLMTSAETNKDTPGVLIRHGIVGAQLRYWAGNIFFGGHLGHYTETISDDRSSISGSGGGGGLVAGWERPDSGWYVMGQLDSGVGFDDVKLHAFRLGLGYRWK